MPDLPLDSKLNLRNIGTIFGGVRVVLRVLFWAKEVF